MTYRSDPPLDNSDIIALLAFGRTRSQGVYTASAPGTNTNDTASASNAILGEALNATFTDRVQRLFGASRVKIDPQFIGSENNPSARVTIEQQISNDITFTYVTSLTQDPTVHHLFKSTNKGVSFTPVDTTTNGLPYGLPILAVKNDPFDSNRSINAELSGIPIRMMFRSRNMASETDVSGKICAFPPAVAIVRTTSAAPIASPNRVEVLTNSR